MKYPLTEEDRQRIASYISRGEEDECWQWDGPVRWGGNDGKTPVPSIRLAVFEGRTRGVAGMIYDMYRGLPEDYTEEDIRWRMRLISTCRNSFCVNPDHRVPGLANGTGRKPNSPEAEARRSTAGRNVRKSGPVTKIRPGWRKQAEEYLESVS